MADFQKITPFFWLYGRAEEAANFYTSIFKNSKIVSVLILPEDPAGGSAMVEFELEGQRFITFDGIPEIPFTEAISFVVNCETQEEIDYLWENLADGGKEVQCGWLQDRFGVSWQIIPAVLAELMQDQSKAQAVLNALLKMVKIDMQALMDAYERA